MDVSNLRARVRQRCDTAAPVGCVFADKRNPVARRNLQSLPSPPVGFVSRGFSSGKRQRELERARKKKEKRERRAQRREDGPAEIEVVSAEDITGALPTIEEAMGTMRERATAPRGAAKIPARLFVGGLSRDTSVTALQEAFEAYGPVADAVVVKDRDTGESRGFGFVTMADRKDAARAMEKLNETVLDGRTIYVNVATDRQR